MEGHQLRCLDQAAKWSAGVTPINSPPDRPDHPHLPLVVRRVVASAHDLPMRARYHTEMAAKLYPKLFLEGAPLTLKTEMCLALNRHPRIVGTQHCRAPSPLVSGKWPGFTNLPSGRGLIDFCPEEESQAMEAFATWARLFELLPYSSWLVDQFHLSTLVHQARGGGPRYDFGWLEERLRPLGFRIILCTRSEDSFAAAREEHRQVIKSPSRYDDLDALVAEQADFRRAAEDSILPCLEIDVSSGDIGAAVDSVATWLHGTGGLNPPWVNDANLNPPAPRVLAPPARSDHSRSQRERGGFGGVVTVTESPGS